MKKMIRRLVLAPVLLATAAFAADTSTLNVPFSFTAHGKSYPAGKYSVSVDANRQVATLASKSDMKGLIAGSLVPSDGNPSSQATVRLEFTSNSNGHELRRIRYGSLSTSDIATQTHRANLEAANNLDKSAHNSGGQ